MHWLSLIPVVTYLSLASGLRNDAAREILVANLSEESSACTPEQCHACCCMETQTRSTAIRPRQTRHKTRFKLSVARVEYRELGICKGAMGSKHGTFGACGKSGCAYCEHGGLAQCENKPLDTCCRYLMPGYTNWRLTLQPWYAMQGKDCSSFLSGAGMGGAIMASEASVSCCEKKKVTRGYKKTFKKTYEQDSKWCEV